MPRARLGVDELGKRQLRLRGDFRQHGHRGRGGIRQHRLLRRRRRQRRGDCLVADGLIPRLASRARPPGKHALHTRGESIELGLGTQPSTRRTAQRLPHIVQYTLGIHGILRPLAQLVGEPTRRRPRTRAARFS